MITKTKKQKGIELPEIEIIGLWIGVILVLFVPFLTSLPLWSKLLISGLWIILCSVIKGAINDTW